MSKHTPGPWRWLSADTLIADHGARPVVLAALYERPGGLPMMTQRSPKSGTLVRLDRDSADARLISAAPEMLEALKAVLSAYEAECKDLPGEPPAELALIRAVIAKAEGKEEDYDPTPWCSACGAMTKAKCPCGPIAAND